MGRFLLQRHLAIPSSEQAKKVEVALCSVSWVVALYRLAEAILKTLKGKERKLLNTSLLARPPRTCPHLCSVVKARGHCGARGGDVHGGGPHVRSPLACVLFPPLQATSVLP